MSYLQVSSTSSRGDHQQTFFFYVLLSPRLTCPSLVLGLRIRNAPPMGCDLEEKTKGTNRKCAGWESKYLLSKIS